MRNVKLEDYELTYTKDGLTVVTVVYGAQKRTRCIL